MILSYGPKRVYISSTEPIGEAKYTNPHPRKYSISSIFKITDTASNAAIAAKEPATSVAGGSVPVTKAAHTVTADIAVRIVVAADFFLFIRLHLIRDKFSQLFGTPFLIFHVFSPKSPHLAQVIII